MRLYDLLFKPGKSIHSIGLGGACRMVHVVAIRRSLPVTLALSPCEAADVNGVLWESCGIVVAPFLGG